MFKTEDLTNEIKRVAAKIAADDTLEPAERNLAKNCLLKYAESREKRAAGRAGGRKFDDSEYHRVMRDTVLSHRVEKELKELREEPTE